MNLIKVAAAVVVAIVLFIVLGHVVSFIVGLLGTLFFIALVAGGGYVAYKLVSGARRREIRRGDRY
ncbi:MAG: hypothetical protein QOG28_5389 [Trebonia sp.]|nr:hypothetical protein [Trebonia sp.]